MSRKLKIIYYVEPDAAALARRAAQYFVEMAGEAVGGAGPGAHRHQRRLHPKAPLSCSPTPISRGALACRGRSSTSIGWMSAAFLPTMPESNYRMTREALLDHVPLRPSRFTAWRASWSRR
jgi:6-phosphogluconolactonase